MVTTSLPGRLVRRLWLLSAGLLLITASAQAQSGFGLPGLSVQQPFDPLQQLRSLSSPASLANSVLLEGAVDPATYAVGPGDVFQVTIGGPQPIAVAAPVSADGRLIVPDIGGVEAAGRPLGEVREEAERLLQERFQNVSVQVALVQPRQFYVHVAGAVPQPGRYPVLPVARVSNALTLAFADTLRAPLRNPAFRPSLRTVQVTRGDSLFTVDLTRYLTTGDVAFNPYLHDGDQVRVPAYDPAQQSVFVDGDVPFSGSFAYRPGDTVLDLLALAAGPVVPQATTTLRHARYQADGSATTQTFELEALQADPDSAPLVEPLDHLFVVPASRTRATATVEGFVHFPGTYPIELGVTTVEELVERAGGLRDDALAQGAHLMRPLSQPAPPPAGVEPPLTLQERQQRLLTLEADSAAFLQRMRLLGFDVFSRTYFAQALLDQGRVPINLDEPDERATYLQPGDRLVVPRDEQTVIVFGQVERPGYLVHEPGLRVEEYIRRAGGRGPAATTTYLLRAGTYEPSTSGRETVNSGDVIFIDGDIASIDPDVEQLRVQDRNLRQQRINLVVSSVVSLTTTIILVLTR
ncbi:MAG: SLBB domain-containing protein [Bacteroidota bacterium]